MVWSTTQSTLYGGEPPREDIPCEAVPQEITRAECPHGHNNALPMPPRRNDPISGLLHDRDALLICAVIFLLLNEKADMKLILALVFVLLG